MNHASVLSQPATRVFDVGVRALVVTSLGALILLAPSIARACACCDGWNTREVLGWSKSGKSALVRSTTVQACEQTDALEVYRVGQRDPAFCFDLRSTTPNARVSCDMLTADFEGDGVRPSSRAQFYPRPGVALDKEASMTRLLPLRDVRSGSCAGRARVSVRLRDSREELLRKDICLGSPDWLDYEAEEKGTTAPDHLPIEVSLWPAPQSKDALLLLKGEDLAPGIGFFPTSVHWVELPNSPREAHPSETRR